MQNVTTLDLALQLVAKLHDDSEALRCELEERPTHELNKQIIAENAAQWTRAEALQREVNVERDARERAQEQTIRLQERLDDYIRSR